MNLKNLESHHNNESCYIFGDGPSIKWFDLSSFMDYPAISCNNFFLHKDFNMLNVKYYVLVPPRLFWPFWMINRNVIKELQPIVKEYRKFIKERLDIQFFVHISNMIGLFGKNVNFINKNLPYGVNWKTLNKLTTIASFCSGAFHASLLLAFFLGFKKIYLVGFDAWTIEPARTLHWYEYGEGQIFEPTNFSSEFLNIMQEEVDIFTISYDGTSRNVTSIPYQNYTGKIPKFRENYELLSEHAINLLATYPGYTINRQHKF